MTNDLMTKYRPGSFEDVIGHEDVVLSIKRVLKKQSSRQFILTGPSGVGKTTLARIIALGMGCESHGIVEIDAATNNGVDSMRQLVENTLFSPMGGGKRVYIIDEAHVLSASAWQSCLKAIEEPPPHIGWCFCTTAAGKIPKTIQTRCSSYDLKPISWQDIYELLKKVRGQEQFKTADDILKALAKECDGSPRRALTWLAQVYSCKSRTDALNIISTADDENAEAIELCRALIGNTTWARAAEIVKRLEGQNPEGVRRVVFAYTTKVALNQTSERRAGFLLEVMDAFSQPYPPDATNGHILLSLAQVLLA